MKCSDWRKKEIAGGKQERNISTTISRGVRVRCLAPAGTRYGTGMFLELFKDYGHGLRAASGVVLLLCLHVLVSFLFHLAPCEGFV